MKKFYEEPIVETTIIMDIVTDEVEAPESSSAGVL